MPTLNGGVKRKKEKNEQNKKVTGPPLPVSNDQSPTHHCQRVYLRTALPLPPTPANSQATTMRIHNYVYIGTLTSNGHNRGISFNNQNYHK